MNKQCMEEMRKMMEKQTKLIVPCIESLGVTTAAEKKEKALVRNRFINVTKLECMSCYVIFPLYSTVYYEMRYGERTNGKINHIFQRKVATSWKASELKPGFPFSWRQMVQ